MQPHTNAHNVRPGAEQLSLRDVYTCMTKTLLFLFLPLLATAADVTGEWNLRLIRFGEQFAAARVTLKTEGANVTGTLNELKLTGTVQGDHLTLTAVRPNGNEWGTFDGTITGDDLAGS